jgi:L-ascorbate metabolism protein UlaG (beta-lactamase superfamily)
MKARRAAPRISRRAWLGGAAGLLSAGTLQWLSLRGTFDHRRCEPARESATNLLAELPPLAAGAADLVHIGHSTHLIRAAGLSILTDPWFFDPAHGGMWHRSGPAVAPQQLGELDVVLITHEHPDHADPHALDRLGKRALVVVPTRELEATVKGLGFTHVERLLPWQALVHRGVEISAVPALHDVYEISYVVRAGQHRIYFAGDTALHRDLPAIAERHAPQVAILPVDGTRVRGEPRLVMTPLDAVQALRVLKSTTVITTHLDAKLFDPVLSWYVTQENDAARTFARAMRAQLPAVRCATLPIGGRVVLTEGVAT